MPRRRLCLLGLLLARIGAAQGRDSVWVNTRSGVYHCPGTSYFGRTSAGMLIREQEAIARGFRANNRSRCVNEPEDPSTKRALLNGQPRTGKSADSTRASARTCVLREVVDADTVDCVPIGRIRLIGIDAPEFSQEPFGRMATSALTRITPIGSSFTLEYDKSMRDRYGRTLAYVWYGGRMLNLQLVQEGWAKSYRYPPDTAHAREFDRAEARARATNQGLWAQNAFACEPRARRRRQC